MPTEHKSTHSRIRADKHASICICIYVYIIYVDESEGKLLYLDIIYFIFSRKENN